MDQLQGAEGEKKLRVGDQCSRCWAVGVEYPVLILSPD